MGIDINEEIDKLIGTIRGYSNDPDVVDQRARSLTITKLEEAKLWNTKVLLEPEVSGDNTIEGLRSVILPVEVPKECYEKVIDYLETIGFFDE